MENRKKEGGVFERDEWQGGGRKISRLSQRDVEEKPVQGCSESEMLERERKRKFFSGPSSRNCRVLCAHGRRRRA